MWKQNHEAMLSNSGASRSFGSNGTERIGFLKKQEKNTGEDWSEKLASEIASLLELPTHHAELAIWEEKRGCAVKSFINQNESVLVHGNELLGGLITGYDKEKRTRTVRPHI